MTTPQALGGATQQDDLKCARGDGPLFLSPLHGAKGGPLMCVPCRLKWDQEYVQDLKRCPDWKRELYGIGDRVVSNAEPTYLTMELLEAAVALTHPDRHPPERAESAKRVTAELLALKPYTRPKLKPKPPTITDNKRPAAAEQRKPLRFDYPCESGFLTVPWFYCDSCRKKYNEIKYRQRERRNHRQRERYRLRKSLRKFRKPTIVCGACGEEFKPCRKDARFCSGACRQKAHRHRVTASQASAAPQARSRNNGQGAAP
jgi:hypothetical protein